MTHFPWFLRLSFHLNSKQNLLWRCWGSVLIPPLGLLYLCCRLKHKSFMVCFFWVLKMVTVKVVFWCFGNLEHRSLWKIKNAFWSLVSVVQSMMREFLASGMCCLMIVHLKVVLYGNSFFHLEVKLHSRPLYLCCLLSWAGNAVCLASVTWRNGLGLRFGFGVVHFPSRINSTRFHHKKIDVSVVTNPNWKGIQNPF